MIYLAIPFGVYIVASSLFIFGLLKIMVNERADHDDRLMAMSNKPEALTQVKAKELDPPNVTYVDEAREAELSPGVISHG